MVAGPDLALVAVLVAVGTLALWVLVGPAVRSAVGELRCWWRSRHCRPCAVLRRLGVPRQLVCQTQQRAERDQDRQRWIHAYQRRRRR